MAWDFETEPEFEAKLAWMREFLATEIMPLEGLPVEIQNDRNKMDELTAPLKQQVRDRDLWAAHLPPELGGGGFGQVKLGLMKEILGRCGHA
ncbi:MAG: acyl-CoA dehydrogenase family protein, partial [Actinomycetota bacterium]|nr:acyl-CoA dehydrogenase family protein [Actinomycetota bacterium]